MKAQVSASRMAAFAHGFPYRVGLLLVLLWLSGCGIQGLTNQVKDSTTQAVLTLDDAISQLGNTSADWQTVLQDTVSKLTQDAQSTIAHQVSDTLNRAVAATGVEVRCNVDFLRTRVRESLIRIRAKLLNQSFPDPEPQFCQVVPAAVDLNLPPDQRNLLTFFGYDFDTTPIQVLLENGNGSVDLSSRIDIPTHYEMTLNLGGNNIPLSSASERFRLKWNDQNISTIAIIQPTTPVCQSHATPSIPVGKITFIPPLVEGDREFDGHGPKVISQVTLVNHHSEVDATIFMSARETTSDWTTASGSTAKTIYTPPPGMEVEQIVGKLTDQFTYTDTNTTVDSFSAGAGGPVNEWEFVGDTNTSDDAGVQTSVTVHFNPLRMILTQTANCVPPTALLSLQQLNHISAATLQRFQPDISKLSPDFLQLMHPRSQ